LSRRPLDPALVSAAVYANSFRTVQRAARATGLRTYSLRQDALRHGGDHRVAEEFLVNSRLRRRDVEFESSVGAFFTEAGATMASLVGHSARPTDDAVPLPSPLPLPMSLSAAIQRRRSVRSYTGESVPLDYVATLAFAAEGVTHTAASGDSGAEMALRSAPSAGALYPVELGVAAMRVDDLPRAVYAYDAQRHELQPIGDETALEGLLASLALADDVVMCSQADLVCLFVARPWRSMRKYGPRGMRHVFLEAGAMAENVNLAAVALGLGAVDCSSVYDDEAHEALGMDGVYEAIVHAQVLGTPA
jgi:SagB-type dehydrogenase family enzyme